MTLVAMGFQKSKKREKESSNTTLLFCSALVISPSSCENETWRRGLSSSRSVAAWQKAGSFCATTQRGTGAQTKCHHTVTFRHPSMASWSIRPPVLVEWWKTIPRAFQRSERCGVCEAVNKTGLFRPCRTIGLKGGSRINLMTGILAVDR